MEERRTSVFENGLIWFGAAVSIAEIITGTYFAPLGFTKGLTAVLIGHIIGCTMLFLAGLIGGRTRRSAMETVKMSFGSKGGIFFSILNVLQLMAALSGNDTVQKVGELSKNYDGIRLGFDMKK